jgi:SAM-dependent methyltransferase
MGLKKDFPDWDTLYKENNIEEMPWYEKNLDPDLDEQIISRNMSNGKFLDIGTGPGTQAIELAKRGFECTETDIAKNAISKARQLSNKVNFVVDDILNSSFSDNTFDFILDRGCFHVFESKLRQKYLEQIKRILKDDGILFLKTMSVEETWFPESEGPYKFSKKDILSTFRKFFEVLVIKSTVYYGKINPKPKALFAVIKQKK